MNRRRLLIVVFLAAAGLRLVPAAFHRFDTASISTPDSALYVDLARNLRTSGDLERTIPAPLQNPVQWEVMRTPGYPALLAALMTIAGNAWPQLVLVVQALLGACSVVLCLLIGERLVGTRAGVVGAALMTIDPAAIVYANMIMSDVPFVSLVTLATWTAVRAAASGRVTHALLAGSILSVATAFRPSGAALLVPLAWYLTAGHRGSPRAGRVSLKLVVALVVSGMLFPCLWMMRNAARTGCTLLSSAYAVNLADVLAVSVRARGEGLTADTVRQRQALELEAGTRPGDVCAGRTSLQQAAFDTFRRYPGATALELMRATTTMMIAGERQNLLRILGAHSVRRSPPGSGTSESWRPSDVLVLAPQVILNVLILGLAVGGARDLARRGNAGALWLLVGIVVAIVVPSVVVGTGRLRAHAAFALYLLAAVPMTTTLSRPRSG